MSASSPHVGHLHLEQVGGARRHPNWRESPHPGARRRGGRRHRRLVPGYDGARYGWSYQLRALKLHVRGFLLNDAPAERLADSVRRVSRGERVIDPELIAAALETGSTPLTGRETDVLRAAESGNSTEQIASRLSLSPATVRNCLSNTISKVGGRNRIDAIRMAHDAGLL